METLTLLIPDSKGGASGLLSENEHATKAADPQIRPYLSQVDRYWGDQPFTSGRLRGCVDFLFVRIGVFYRSYSVEMGIACSNYIDRYAVMGEEYDVVYRLVYRLFPHV